MFSKHDEDETQLMRLIRLSEDTTHVRQDDFRSGTVRLYSEGFARCIGLVFLDYDRTRGALAHLSPGTTPDMFVNGFTGHPWGGQANPIEKLDEIYDDPSRVKVIQVYDANSFAWLPRKVQYATSRLGFTDFSYVRLKNNKNRVYHKAIALDVREGLAHIETTANTGILTIPFFPDNF